MTERDDAGARPLADVREEGLRIVRAAGERALPVRLLGGVAVWARCPSTRRPELAREYGDVDLVTPARSAREAGRLLEELGYEPDKLFNALHGAQRMNFRDVVHDRPLDVLVDRFAMCHALDLADRLLIDEVTIPLADLLLTKLQVVKINEKDLLDLLALLVDHAVRGSVDHSLGHSPGHSRDAIDLDRVVRVLSADWGFEHTARANLERLPGFAEERIDAGTAGYVRARTAVIEAALLAAPKTLGWRVRSRVGERVRWYELPEDVRH
jgi:Uncharacterised nucleotidyltransferase